MPSFEQVNGLKGFMIAPTAIIKGLGMSIDLQNIQVIVLNQPQVEGATGDYHSNYINKGQAAFEQLTKNQQNFGFIHIKSVDEAGHDKSIELKIKSIKKTDDMIKHIVE